MRTPDGPVTGDPRHLLPGHGHAQLLKLGDHAPRPGHPVVPDQLALGEQRRLLGVEEVRQHVHADAVEPAGELGSGDQREPLGQRGDRLGMATGGVVIGQCDDVQTDRGGLPHQLGGSVRTVGSGGVGVQIDLRTTRTPDTGTGRTGLLAADVLVLGYGDHTTAVVCTILSGAFIGVNNTVYTELALGVSDAPRPVASAGYNFVRWFAAAAAPYFAPKIEEWTDIHIPFVVAAVTAVVGALVVAVRRKALTHEAQELEPKHATEDGVAVFAN
ncbi:hypothetical protein SVIOM74S_08303 [Streptomyces violarus]